MNTMTPAEVHAEFSRHGVVKLKQALKPEWMRAAEAAYQWSLQHRSGTAADYNQTDTGKFFVDTANPDALPVYRDFLCRSPVSDLVAQAWNSSAVWYGFEQVFYKEGGATRGQRTGWHQDSSYLSFDGEHLAVMWITFDPLPKDFSLEFVRGSHRGPLYEQRGVENPTRPTVPRIEANRDQFDIVSWAIEPGDVLLFHPAILHGGGGTQEGRRRRTLSLRFIGEDVTFTRRPSTHDTPPAFLEMNQALKEGDPFRHPSFLKLRD
jgi:ectoine hydroxylase-related dioxygenase (phytanoyl-CoA dioxygenase family)